MILIFNLECEKTQGMNVPHEGEEWIDNFVPNTNIPKVGVRDTNHV